MLRTRLIVALLSLLFSLQSANISALDIRSWSTSTNSIPAAIGKQALKQVQQLAGRVAQRQQRILPSLLYEASSSSTGNDSGSDSDSDSRNTERDYARYDSEPLVGAGGIVMINPTAEGQGQEKQVWTALANLERDMQLLDKLTGQKAQLSPLELTLLFGSVVAAATGPFVMNGEIKEFVAPAAAALSAAIGIGAEYVGKVAVADGKEVAAQSIQCAAESEGFLAQAERAKAVTPLCVGIGATALSFALLVPVLLASLAVETNLQLVTEIYLCCPLLAVLSAAVSSLALQETRAFSRQAISVGNRRFAKSGLVGRTWLSTSEQIEKKSQNASLKWKSFALSVLPAPILGALVPGALPTKTIVVTALAAAQSALFLAQCEYTLSRATDAVALKARSAAVCDTYANQASRAAAILPFTSALSSLCAAATAAIVEFPFLEELALKGGVLPQIIVVAFFPTFSAMFAAAASVSKARCEVDAEAAMQAASTLALGYDSSGEDDPVLRPLRGVVDLIKLTTQSSILEPIKRRMQYSWLLRASARLISWIRHRILYQPRPPVKKPQWSLQAT